MRIIERLVDHFFPDPNFDLYYPVGAGEIGKIIQETEADFIEHWLNKIERDGIERKKPITEKERKAILERDHHTCLVPHCETAGYRLNVHHLYWREFGGNHSRNNLATLCLHHHMEAHPGMEDAFRQYRAGEKNAFKNYIAQNEKWKIQPTPRIMDIVAGIVYQKEKRNE